MSEASALAKLRALYQRRMSNLEAPPLRILLHQDGSLAPDPAREALAVATSRAWAIYLNALALVEGPHSRVWWMQVPHGQRLYLSGRAKPSLVQNLLTNR